VRFIQISLLLAFLAAVAAFALQNNALVAVRFLTWKISAPLSLLVVGMYVLGMVSGGVVVGFLRRSLRQVPEPPR